MTKEDFKKVIIENYKKGKKIVLVNIGTEKYIGDSFAPLLGSMLMNQISIIKVYGTLNDTINGINLSNKIEYINKMHENDFIVGIDCAISNSYENCQKDFVILNEPLVPGEGVDVELPKVGSICIHFCIASESGDIFEDLKRPTIKDIYNRSKQAAEFIFDLDDELSRIKIYMDNKPK